MGEWIAMIAGEILLWIEEIKFWKKKKARRKYEKENNLPKKLMIHPAIKVLGLGIALIFILKILIGYFYFSNRGENETSEKIAKIVSILDKEKNIIGYYPEKLNEIIRNNPLRQNITTDYWGNEFFYEISENGLSYLLVSKGKDGIINTGDDIKK
jgi:hypothetical protein